MASVIEWFWRGSKLAQAKRELAEPSERAATYAQRAHASAGLAQNVLSPNEPEEAHLEAYACELYRQSVYWSLCALASRSDSEPSGSYDPALWDSLDSQVLAKASTDERAESLNNALRGGTFVQFAELPITEQVATCAELRALAQTLLKGLDQRAERLSAIYLERMRGLALLGVLALALLVGAFQISSALERRRDFAYDRPWVVSSQFSSPGCTSPAQQCSEANGYFFHTNEEDSPWVEFDLGAKKTVSKVDVANRTDCCGERAAPITVEVSTNHRDWRSVARRDTEFTQWTASFAPVEARWVRLRLLKRNYFHLSHVSVH